MKDIDITIDDNNAIRVLPIEKFTASQRLKGESNKFVSSNYNKINNLIYLYRNYPIQWLN